MTTSSARSAPRARGTPGVAAELSRLTDRDKQLIDLLHEHQVLTTQHINAMLFDHPATGRNRLRLLANRDVLSHFRGYVSAGSESWRWTLGYLGRCYLAARDGTRKPRPQTVQDDIERLATSPSLRHLLGINEFFVHLHVHARAEGRGAALEAWWSEHHCAQATGGLVRPDGFGQWTQHGVTVRFWLEYDRSTASTKEVAAKLEDYQRLHDAAGRRRAEGLRNAVLIRMQTPLRETNLHEHLRRHPAVAERTLLVATMSGPAQLNPAGPVWTVAGGNHYGPLRLADLADQQPR